MIAFLNAHVAGFTLSLPRAHCQHSFCCVHTSTLDVNQHKGMSLLFPRRGGVRNLPTFSPSDYLLQILLLFLTKSGPQERSVVVHKIPAVQVSRVF